MKEIHFYETINLSKTKVYPLITWNSTENAILKQNEIIHTMQMGFLSWSDILFDNGYRIFIHESFKDMYEIKLGENERTNRYIRRGHNIFKLWMSGEFEKREPRKLGELTGEPTVFIDPDYKRSDVNDRCNMEEIKTIGL